MICVQCSWPVFDPEDLIDGLCTRCVDDLLTLRIPSNDGGFERKPTRKSAPKGKTSPRTELAA